MTDHDLQWPAQSRPLRILLTGFGPFPGVPCNLSGDVVERAAARLRDTLAEQAEIFTETIPTAWASGQQRILQLHDQLAPDIALHFGVSTVARGFCIERRAVNMCRLNETDCTGATAQSESIVENRPNELPATLPADAIVARLRAAGLPADLSDDAGRYLCNAVLYRSLHYSQSQANASSTGFVHIPTELSAPPLTFDDAVRGALLIVNTCCQYLPHIDRD